MSTLPIPAQIMEAVVAAIKQAELEPAVTARRSYRPTIDRNRADQPEVIVSLGPIRCEAATRAERLETIAIELALVAPITLDTNAIDKMVALLRQIDLLLRWRDWETTPPVHWRSSEFLSGADAGFVSEMLDQQHLFFGLLRITYSAYC